MVGWWSRMWGEVYKASANAENNMKVTVYECQTCDVRGRCREIDPLMCWNCGGHVKVIARPYIAKDSW